MPKMLLLLLLLPTILLLNLDFFAVLASPGQLVPLGGGAALVGANANANADLAQPAGVQGLWVPPQEQFVPPPPPTGMEEPKSAHGKRNRKLQQNEKGGTGSRSSRAKVPRNDVAHMDVAHEEVAVAAGNGEEGGHGRRLAARVYTLNINNNCASSLYVESYTRVSGQRLPQAPNLAPGASYSIQVSSADVDVELNPFENCTGPNGTNCSSGGCKNKPGTEQCAQGDGHMSQIRFDFHVGKQDTYNNNVNTNGFNVPARVVPSNPACSPMDLTASSADTVVCDNTGQNSVHFDVTYCP